jgi:hypothetical protein
MNFSGVLGPVLQKFGSRYPDLIFIATLKAKDRQGVEAALHRSAPKAMFTTAIPPIKHNPTFVAPRANNVNVVVSNHCLGSTPFMVPEVDLFVFAISCWTGTVEIVHTFFNYNEPKVL